MTTWAELRADVRTELKDASETSPKWSNDTLFLFAKDAIRVYSQDFPLEAYQEELTASGGKFGLPTGFLREVSVEKPLGRYLKKAAHKPGFQIRLPSQAYTYRIVGSAIYLDCAPNDGEALYLTYGKMHAIPSSPDDDDAEMTFPTEDEELIRLYVRAKAIEQFRTVQANLDRFKITSGSRDDNPLLPEFKALYDEYYRRVNDKLGGVITLYRPGRAR